MEKEGASFEELEHLTLGSLRKAVIDGDVVNGSLMAGQSAGMVKKEESCKRDHRGRCDTGGVTAWKIVQKISAKTEVEMGKTVLCFRDREHST